MGDDYQTSDVVISDLESLQTRDVNFEERSKATRLLAIMKELRRDAKIDHAAEVQALIMLSPTHPEHWRRLAADSGAAVPAELAVFTASKAAAPSGGLQSSEIAQAYAGTGTAADAQRGIMLAPFDACGWRSLLDSNT